jgi:hypothetical protein
MYEAVGAFTHRPELSWVTIGDGRFGLDSIRLQRLGVRSVLPTDIGGALLEAGVQQGLINDYRVENAESLSFSDGSFDMVFCKESYHHFPRPFLALAEMVRVARYAVILVEPRDYVIDRPQFKALGPKGLVRGLWNWVKNRLEIPGKPLPLAKRYQLGDAPHLRGLRKLHVHHLVARNGEVCPGLESSHAGAEGTERLFSTGRGNRTGNQGFAGIHGDETRDREGRSAR